MDIMEKIRTISKKVMVVFGALVFLFGLIDLIIIHTSDPSGMFVISTFSVIFGICNFALALALAAVTFLKKANLKTAALIGVPAIGGFVIALIMTNFTSATSLLLYIAKNYEAGDACLNAPLILSMIFAAALISAAIRGIKDDKFGSYTPTAYNPQQPFSNQVPGQQMQNPQVPTPEDNKKNNMQ